MADSLIVTSRDIDVFNRVADRYDEVIPFFTAFAKETASALPLASGSRVLDLGAGRGAFTTEALARRCRVTAIDAAPNMVERLLDAHIDHAGLDAAYMMDAHHLELPGGHFDTVVSHFVVHLLDHPSAALGEVLRVLSPEGVFAFTVPGAAPGFRVPESVEATDPLAELFAEFGQYLSPEGGMGRPLDARELLTAAGFVDVKATTITVDLPVADGETLWQWGLTHGSLAYFEDLPVNRRAEFRARRHAATEAAGPSRLRRTAAMWTGRKPER
ncbi:class I SAM-dependent methyltransferase [Nocardiopsis aegyptia]|uniref:class I SAM-dependent methyltransferase n=1 Tax=Nocardiopsis aegyptia TaxID=220378 RepID=UPI00366CC794